METLKKGCIVGFLLVFLIGLMSIGSYAQEQKAKEKKPAVDAEEKTPPADVTKENKLAIDQTFLGLNWGIAVAAAYTFEKDPSVDEAEILNGSVWVTRESKASPRVMLETHYFLSLRSGKWGWGPFLAIQPASGDLLGTIAGGVMVGIKNADDKNNNSFNVGIGPYLINNYKELTAGLVDGKMAPEGLSTIKYKTRAAAGICLVFSFSFKIGGGTVPPHEKKPEEKEKKS